MSQRTCKYCNKTYEDSSKYWYNKICCYDCWRNKETKYKVGDKVYSYYNTKQGRNGILTPILTEATVVRIYVQYRPTLNGLYQYSLEYYNDIHKKNLIEYRFIKDIFDTKEEAENYINKLIVKRKLMRQAREQIKNT